MKRVLRIDWAAVAGLCAAMFAVAAARGDDGALDRLYGEGVHSYFGGDADSAHKALSTAIEAGSRDPRAYYFRGLASLRMGYRDAALDDFKAAATIESRSPDAATLVSQSLQRIQGSTRSAIEKHRADARLVAFQQQRARDAARYGETRTRDREEVQSRAAPRSAGTAKAADAAAPPAAAGAEQATEELFGDKPADAAVEEMPADGDAPADAAAPAGDAPATEPATEETPMTEETPAADATEEAPAAEDPATEAPAAEAPATETPAAEAPAAKDAPAAKAPEAKKQAGAKKGMGFGKLADIIARSAGSVGASWGKTLEKTTGKLMPGGSTTRGGTAGPGGKLPTAAAGKKGAPVLPASDAAPEKADPFQDEGAAAEDISK